METGNANAKSNVFDDIKIKISADTSELEAAIEKANQLKQLLGEVSDLISSLGGIVNNCYVTTNHNYDGQKCDGRGKVGEVLRELRGNKTQEAIARDIGVTKSSWAMYERDERMPRDEVKIKIADYFGRTVQEIFFGQFKHVTCAKRKKKSS